MTMSKRNEKRPAVDGQGRIVRTAHGWLFDEVDQSPRRCTATLTWDPKDPWAVAVNDGVHPVVSVGRDLFAEGSAEEAAVEDAASLYVFAEDGHTALCVRGVPGWNEWMLKLREQRVRQIVGPTYRLVPAGAETDRIDLDGELAALFGEVS